jgi:hypothetical protein
MRQTADSKVAICYKCNSYALRRDCYKIKVFNPNFAHNIEKIEGYRYIFWIRRNIAICLECYLKQA